MGDFVAIVQQFLQMMDGGDPVGTLLLAGAMLYLGNIAGRLRPAAHRLACYAAMFVGAFYALYAVAAYGRMAPACILGITWRALLAAGVAYGVVGLATAFAVALIAPISSNISQWIDRRIQRVTGWLHARRRRADDEARQRADDEHLRQLAPLREQQRTEAALAERKRAELQEFRRTLRFECQLGYNRLRPAVVEMFPQEEFNRLVDDALRGEVDADLRWAAQELVATVQAVVGGQEQDNVKSLLDVAQDFDQRRATVEATAFSDERKDDLAKYLNMQEAIEIRKVLEQ